jgi:hypothetical protein
LVATSRSPSSSLLSTVARGASVIQATRDAAPSSGANLEDGTTGVDGSIRDRSEGGGNAGLIAGIVLGSLLACAVVGAVLYFTRRDRRKAKRAPRNANDPATDWDVVWAKNVLVH